MQFEVVDVELVPAKRVSKYSAVKVALKDLPLGKAMKISSNGDGVNMSTIKCNINNWATQFGCWFATRNDRPNNCLWVWKLENKPTEK